MKQCKLPTCAEGDTPLDVQRDNCQPRVLQEALRPPVHLHRRGDVDHPALHAHK